MSGSHPPPPSTAGRTTAERTRTALRHTLDPRPRVLAELLERMRARGIDDRGIDDPNDRVSELLLKEEEAGPALPSPPSGSELGSDPKLLGSLAILEGLTKGKPGARLEGKKVVVLGVAQNSTKCYVCVLHSGGGCAGALKPVIVKRDKLRLRVHQ